MTTNLAALRRQFPRAGEVTWIGVRTDRDEPMAILDAVEARSGAGLTGDRFSARRSDVRAVTLIQAEHLAVIANLLGFEALDPELVRRNVVVRGLNLLAAKEVRLRIGEVVLEYTGQCHPCSKMERRLGPGAYNAMRGHGGITARVISGGVLRVGDPVNALTP